MKRLVKPLAATIVLLEIASGASAQTADEVIEKTVTAIGGRAALAKVKSRRRPARSRFKRLPGTSRARLKS